MKKILSAIKSLILLAEDNRSDTKNDRFIARIAIYFGVY
jgi:hypothetical protein